MPRRPTVSEGLPLGPLRYSQVKGDVGRHVLRTSAFAHLGRDLYAPAGCESGLITEVRALALVMPAGAAFSHDTAAALLGLPTPSTASPRVHVSVLPDADPPARPRVRGHCVALPAEHVVTVVGLPVTQAARVFVDVAARWSVPDLVALGDQALRRGHVERSTLDELVAWADGRRGVRRARKAVAMLDAAAESPPESWIRVWLADSGLPAAEVNGWICDPTGRPTYRGDLVYRPWRLIVEYEGAYHRQAEQYGRDLRRRNDLVAWGCRVVHLDAVALRSPAAVTSMVRVALQQQGWRG